MGATLFLLPVRTCPREEISRFRSAPLEMTLEMRDAPGVHVVISTKAEGRVGEPLTTASGGNIVRGEVNRNERSVLWTVATIEVADEISPPQRRSSDKQFSLFHELRYLPWT